MKLLTQRHIKRLLNNGRRQEGVRGTDAEIDFDPVVKLFYPAGAATWLLTELEPDDPDIAWGLCDLGMGFPEFGTVSLKELKTLHAIPGLGVERDRFFKARGPISRYITAAFGAGRIIEDLSDA